MEDRSCGSEREEGVLSAFLGLWVEVFDGEGEGEEFGCSGRGHYAKSIDNKALRISEWK